MSYIPVVPITTTPTLKLMEKKENIQLLLVVGHRLEIIIDHRLESVAAVDAIF